MVQARMYQFRSRPLAAGEVVVDGLVLKNVPYLLRLFVFLQEALTLALGVLARWLRQIWNSVIWQRGFGLVQEVHSLVRRAMKRLNCSY